MNQYPQLNGALMINETSSGEFLLQQLPHYHWSVKFCYSTVLLKLTTFNKNKGAAGNPEAPLLANIKLVAVEGVEPPTLRI